MRPRVVLYAHRLAAAEATGIGRVAVELGRALQALAPASPYDLSLWTLPEPSRVVRRGVQLAWSVAGRPRIDTARLAGRADLVHALQPTTPVPSTAPVIYTVHDLMTLHHPDWYRPAERWAYERAFRDVRRRAAHVITDSEWVAAQVRAELGVAPDRISVVPCGVSRSVYRAVADDEVERVTGRYGLTPVRYAVAVGAVSTRKNLLSVVRAVAGTTIELAIAGPPGIGGDAVATEIDRLGLAGQVRLLGYVPDADLPALLAGALALVHPSLDEGFGLTPLEAMAVGVPAIVSRSGALPEVVADAALTVDRDDPDAWRQALEAVRDDPAGRRTLIEAGRRRAARFTWDEAARRTLAVYEKVLG